MNMIASWWLWTWAALGITAHMHALVPVRCASDLILRFQIARAIESVTADPLERAILSTIAARESLYERDVVRCERMGKAGDRTAWQIVPRSRADAARLCVSLEGDAAVALERIRESRGACRRSPLNEQLGIYTRGRCDSDHGRALSRQRWPSARDVTDFFADL